MAIEVLFIPSCGIEPTDKLSPQDTLIRLFHGLCLWESGDYKMILVTGGFSYSPFVQTKPASHIMRDWLIGRGVNPDCILVEDQSVDTFESIKFGLQTLRQRMTIELLGEQVKLPVDITVVTHRQHARRYWVSFKLGYGINVRLANLDYQVPSMVALEEWLCLAYHLLDPKGKGPLARNNRTYLKQLASSL